MTLSIPLLFGAFQGIFLALILALKRMSAVRGFLITLLILSSLFLTYEHFVFKGDLLKYPDLIGVYLPLLFTIPPLFYLFIREASVRQGLTKTQLVHAVPAALVLLIMLPYYAMPSDEKLLILLDHRSAGELYPYRNFLTISFWISASIYGLKSHALASKTIIKKAAWIRSFSKAYLLLIGAITVVWGVSFVNENIHREIMLISVLIFSIFIHFIGFTAFKTSSFLPASKKTGTLSAGERKALKSKIIDVIENESAFKDNDFSLRELSEKLKTNTKYLSAIINDEFECSFTFLVNSYRIKAAKKMILNDQYAHLNFLGIANAVGFSNKNSFTRAFKRHTGQTPSEFRANQRQQ